jgi:hypothetical protein
MPSPREKSQRVHQHRFQIDTTLRRSEKHVNQGVQRFGGSFNRTAVIACLNLLKAPENSKMHAN